MSLVMWMVRMEGETGLGEERCLLVGWKEEVCHQRGHCGLGGLRVCSGASD
jgi:hypothetical protein